MNYVQVIDMTSYGDRGSKNVMLVGFDPLQTMLLEDWLGDDGYRVMAAESPAQAMEMVDHQYPHVVVDVFGHGYSPEEAAQMVRSLDGRVSGRLGVTSVQMDAVDPGVFVEYDDIILKSSATGEEVSAFISKANARSSE
jgi:CheY-like chemotaxis protein